MTREQTSVSIFFCCLSIASACFSSFRSARCLAAEAAVSVVSWKFSAWRFVNLFEMPDGNGNTSFDNPFHQRQTWPSLL